MVETTTKSKLYLQLADTKQSTTNDVVYCTKKFDIINPQYPEPVGYITLRVTENPAVIVYHGNVEYEVYKTFRGNGYAGIACQMLKEEANKSGVANLWMTIIPDNNKSIKVCEKLGAFYCGSITKGKMQRKRYKLPVVT